MVQLEILLGGGGKIPPPPPREKGITTTKLKQPIYPGLSIPLDMNIQKSNLVGTLPSIGKEYQISFDLLVINHHKGTDARNILHITTGGNHGKYGDRIPGIWIWDRRLSISSALNGNHNSHFQLPTELEEGIWNSLHISQILIDSKAGGQFKVFLLNPT